MATLRQLGNERKQALRALRKLSVTLDAAQEATDRELVRLINRKTSVPEGKDLERLASMIKIMQDRGNTFYKGVTDLARAFTV